MKHPDFFILAVFFFKISHISATNFPHLDNTLVPKADHLLQEKNVRKLIHRLLPPDVAQHFSVQINPFLGPLDTFVLTTTSNSVNNASESDPASSTNNATSDRHNVISLSITATSGVGAALGFHFYLTRFGGCHVSWGGVQIDSLPRPLPVLTAPVRVTTNTRWRYYQNVCTSSYSFAFWKWKRWERHLDWMAMKGINLPLAFTGQEAIWRRVYTSLGLTDAELDSHFGGVAFLAWARMGNIKGWGGPLSQEWHQQQLTLQHKILTRMHEFGMIPVLPAFAGHVPDALVRVLPNANVTRLPHWGKIDDPKFTGTLMLDPTDPLFSKIGRLFLNHLREAFPFVHHAFSADSFNEMQPKSGDHQYLANVARGIFDGMTAGDPNAVWLMQTWMFLKPFWTPERVKSLVRAVPIGRLVLLDLYAEIIPTYKAFDSYYGQPFIWCMLHNFGGNNYLYGSMWKVNEGAIEALEDGSNSLVGFGLTPEGIGQNDAVYELMTELFWRREKVDLDQWIEEYYQRRYGLSIPSQLSSANLSLAVDFSRARRPSPLTSAWRLLVHSVYDCRDHFHRHGRFVYLMRPRRKMALNLWYDPIDVFKAWDFFVEATKEEEGVEEERAMEEEEEENVEEEATDEEEEDVEDEDVEEDDEEDEEDYGEKEDDIVNEEIEGLCRSLSDITDLSDRSTFKTHHLKRRSTEAAASSAQYLFSSSSSRLVASKLAKSDLFKYDLVDVTREGMQLVFIHLHHRLIAAYQSQNVSAFHSATEQVREFFNDLDELLGSDRHFLLGDWLEEAKRAAIEEGYVPSNLAGEGKSVISPQPNLSLHRNLYEFNARTQITIWSPKGSLKDYANKQWSGLVADYYARRWAFFTDALLQALLHPEAHPFNASKYVVDVFEKVEKPFGRQERKYPTSEIGDSYWLAKKLHAKWRPITRGGDVRKFYRIVGRWAKKGKLRKMKRKWTKRINRKMNE